MVYWGQEVETNKLKSKINGQIIKCNINGKDRYDRFIAECFKGITNLNSWMVRKGYAVAYIKYSKKYVAQEKSAKKNKLGLWKGTFEKPWDWRKKN